MGWKKESNKNVDQSAIDEHKVAIQKPINLVYFYEGEHELNLNVCVGQIFLLCNTSNEKIQDLTEEVR